MEAKVGNSDFQRLALQGCLWKQSFTSVVKTYLIPESRPHFHFLKCISISPKRRFQNFSVVCCSLLYVRSGGCPYPSNQLIGGDTRIIPATVVAVASSRSRSPYTKVVYMKKGTHNPCSWPKETG